MEANSRKLKSETVFQENVVRADSGAPLTRFRKSYAEFDQEGRQVKEFSWDVYGNVEQMLISEYDKGLMVKQKVYLEEDELSEEHVFKYDSHGRLIEEQCTYSESGHERITYDYDGQGGLMCKAYLDEEDLVESFEEWEYDGDRMVAERRFEEGDLVYEHLWEYDDEVLVKEKINEDLMTIEVLYEPGNPEIRKEIRNGVLVSKQSTWIDESGKPVKVEEQSSAGVSTMTVEYDQNGNEVLREERGPDGSVRVKIQRQLDGEGQLVLTEVEANTRGMGIDRHYRYIYEYSYFD